MLSDAIRSAETSSIIIGRTNCKCNRLTDFNVYLSEKLCAYTIYVPSQGLEKEAEASAAAATTKSWWTASIQSRLTGTGEIPGSGTYICLATWLREL
jgi:hypothetical protein